ncbi:diguanylate cyclase domain protein [Geobacillus kaustophilus]|uniref:Diguanylate cyclase domain protein n=1 Tax=Geobacillus kaustophilus TaxID=1462 RepID=A0A0D8BWL3_GEOKU|nr:EAL domain-containing protein [Geobacillus kaustophilus]KJE28578.1 diguanylate cyclase domain protein [Geobacillus kaustophilus]
MDKQSIMTHYGALYFFMPAVQWVVNEHGVIADMNDYAGASLGYDRIELIGAPFQTIFHPDDWASLVHLLPQPTDEAVRTFTARTVHKTGKLCPVRVHMRWKALNGTPFLLVSCSDMTAETHAERLLAEQTHILKQIAKHEPLDAILTSIAKAAEALRPPAICSILLADDNGRRLYHGAAPSLPSAYIEAMNGIEIGPQSGSCGAAAYQKEIVIASNVANDPRWTSYAQLALAHGLRACWSMPILSSSGHVLGTLAFYYPTEREPEPEDMEIMSALSSLASLAMEHEGTRKALEENRRLYDSLFHYHYDELTGLPNRRRFLQLAEAMLLKLNETKQHGAILYIDLDGFQYINDSFGHHIGDKLLQQTAARLRERVRPHGIAAHMSGDEFIVLLAPVAGHQEASAIAEDLLALIAQPFSLAEQTIFITASIGIVLFDSEQIDVDTAIRQADMAAMEAKRKGKNSYCLYEEALRHQRLPNVFLLADLHQAVKQNMDGFVLLYQPIVDVRTKAVSAMETLIRWHHPTEDVVPPGDFIPLAEETGLIIPIGEWTIQQACRQHERWRQQGFAPIRMAVNVSVKELHHPQFAARVEAILAETNMRPSWLELEITETIAIYQEATILANLHRLKEMGVRLSIDDFGTGYSSLAYLKQLDIDTVKIDRTFISDCPHSHYGSIITNTIISLARHLGMNVVAEGVEREEQLEHLREKGCHEAQGYLFRPPMPADEAAGVLARSIERRT